MLLPLPSHEWPCHLLPVVTEEAWGAGTTQPCHLRLHERDATPAKVLDEAYSGRGAREQSLGGKIAVYPAWWGSFIEATARIGSLSLKRCWRYVCAGEWHSWVCNLERDVWNESERRSMPGMLNQKHGEGEVVEMWSVTCLWRISTQTTLQWGVFLGRVTAFLWPQSTADTHSLLTEQ